MSEGSITRKASDLRPLLLDRFRNAAAAYSLRPLTLSGQDNPVVKVRRSVDDTEQDFNPAQINDGTLEQFVNAGDVAPADYGTGAAAAYSLRHVSDGYTGDVVRVRRSVDNTEQDFNPTEIEDGTLTSFVGGQNLALRSQEFGNSYWLTQSGVTKTSTSELDPDGGNTAALITYSSNGFLYQYFNVTPNQYTVSIYAKSDTKTRFKIAVFGATIGYSVTSSLSLTNEYQRFTHTFTAGAADRPIVEIIPDSETGSMYIAFAQIEEGSTAGDYVPTTNTIAGDGHVTTWYDQSGNSNDATQATAASQPKIVSGGSLVTENGKPAIDFDGVDDALQTSSLAISQPYTVFNVVKSDITGAVNFVWSTSTTATSLIFVDTDIIRISAGVSLNSAINQRDTNQTLLSNFYNGATSSIYKDGASIASGNAGTNTLNDLRVGAPGFASQLFDGKHQEIIVYSDDQSSNRELIETNVNHYYSIYSQTNDGFVTTWYDQSGNGNHATQSTAASQPKIVSAGSLVVENGKAALDFYSTSVTISAPNMTNSTNCDVFLVYKISGNSVFASNGGTTPPYFLIVQDGQGSSVFTFYGTPEVRVNDALISPINRNILHDTIIDSQKLITVSAADFSSQTIFEINGFGGSLGNTGKVQETVIYPTDRSSTRQQIESNINTHYGIY